MNRVKIEIVTSVAMNDEAGDSDRSRRFVIGVYATSETERRRVVELIRVRGYEIVKRRNQLCEKWAEEPGVVEVTANAIPWRNAR